MLVAVLIYPGLTALDAIGPYEVLNTAGGFDLRFVWKRPGPVLTDHGALTLGATHALAEAARPDVLIVPGSSANTGHAMRDAAILEYVREAHAHTRFTTSVCSGALVLAAAGILRDHPATTHWAVMSSLARHGALPRPDERVVRSGKIITAAGVSAGIDMAFDLLAALRGEEAARVAQLGIEYDPRPPFDAGRLSHASPATHAASLAMLRQRGATPVAWD